MFTLEFLNLGPVPNSTQAEEVRNLRVSRGLAAVDRYCGTTHVLLFRYMVPVKAREHEISFIIGIIPLDFRF